MKAEGRYNQTMRARYLRRMLCVPACALAVLSTGVDAQKPPAPSTPPPTAKPAPAQTNPQRDIFRSRVDLVTSDVIVRDSKGQFVADLKKAKSVL